MFSTVNAKCNGAGYGSRGGGIWLHSFLTLTIYGSGQNHTWSLYAWLKSPHYPLNARFGGPRIWNERFREKIKFVAPLSGSNPEFLGCPTHSLLTQQTLLYCFISHFSNHFYLKRNQQQAFFSLFAKADHQIAEIPHHIKQIRYKNATKVEKLHQIKQITNKNIKRAKDITRLRISHKSRE